MTQRVVACRWFKTHHQVEAVGPAGGPDRQVWVAPRRSRVLRWLPDSHVGADPREESHGCGVLAPPLACPLVETSRHCTPPTPPPPPLFLSHSLQRLQQITFQFGHIRWIFISLFCFIILEYVCFVIELMLLCMFALYLLVLLLVRWRRESNRFILFCGHFCSNCCDPFTHPLKRTCSCTASDSSLFVTLLH